MSYNTMKTLSRMFGLPLLMAALSATSFAQLQNAGTLVVEVDATKLPIGPTLWVTNSGSVGGVFQATGLAANDLPIVNSGGGGTKGILFDGNNFMEHVSAPGTNGTIVPAPSQLVGMNPPSSIEVWVVNPTFWPDNGETLVAWGVRDTSMRNMAFTYSANNDHGAVDRWGGNMPWAPVPPAGQWHHLVFTFDGSVTRIYADGVLNNSLPVTTVNTTGGTPITLAAQRNADGTPHGGDGTRGSLTIGKVRIHTAALTAEQVLNNYNVDKTNFVFAPQALASRPASRYTFNEAATNDAVGLTVADQGIAPAGPATVQGNYGTTSASFDGTRVRLGGGSSDVAPYVDLPNGIISSRSAANGGAGKVSVEGWVNVTAANSWHRLFDFGSTESGELTGPALPGAAGRNYFMLAQVSVNRDWHQVEINNHGHNGGPAVSSFRAFGLYNNTGSGFGLRHYVVTWDEATDEVLVYENGVLSTRMVSTSKINQIDDVNAWLGRSNWTADQNMAGEYDEFRVYSHVLTPGEVRNNYEGGPDTVLVVPGPIQNVRITAPRTNMMAGTFQNLELIADYQNVTNLTVTTRPGVLFASGNTNVVRMEGAIARAVAAGSAVITASYDGRTNTVTLNVTPESAPLTHRYPFNNDANDVVGGPQWQGTPFGGAFTGTEIMLEGASSTVQLPPGIITNLDAVTIETWASFGSPLGTWSELFAFGDRNDSGQGRNYIMMTPHSNNNDSRLSIADADPGFNHEQVAISPGVLDGQTNVHIAAVYHPYAGYIALYLNGVLAGINRNVTIPLSSIDDVQNYIGQSIYQGDPFVAAWVNEFRIYGGPLTATQIAVNSAAGPNSIVTDPGVLQSVTLSTPTQVITRASSPSVLRGNFANVSGVNLASFGAFFTSGNTNILTVNSNGVITGVSPGTTTIVGSYGGYSQTQSVTVANLPATLTHRYDFNANSNDMIGNKHAQLMGNAQLLNGQLVLDGTAGTYADLGAGVVTGLVALTVETWASFGPNQNWVRLYDFGDQNASGGGVTSIFFSPHTGNGNGEMTIFVPSANEHIWPAGMGVLDNTTNLHIVGVYDPLSHYQGLYFNGLLVAENRTANIPITSVNNVLSYLGRSLFNADPYLNGTIDEFRVYSGALSPQQIAANKAAGPNNLVTNLGPLQTVRFVAQTNMLVDARQQAQLLGDYANLAGVNLFAFGNPTVISSDPNVVSVDASGGVRALGTGQATLTAIYNGVSYNTTISVSTPASALKHRYSFNEAPGTPTAIDSVSAANATLMPGADFTGTGRLALDGTNGYVVLPSPLVSVLSNATFEVWVTPTSAGNWQRIFDFGIDNGAGAGSSYVFLSARGAPGVRFTVKPTDGPEAPILNAETPLMIGQPSHLVAVYNASAGVATLYQNGQFIASGTIVTPLSAIPDVNNWLGRSQYASDALFAGTYDEFRIWDGPMMPSQVQASYATGPNQLPIPKLDIDVEGMNVRISWPLWGAGFTLQQKTALDAGTWQPVPGTPVQSGNGYALTVPATGQARFFRLVPQ